VVQDIIKKADVVLEVLDARMVELTRNRKLEEYIKKIGRKQILIINKSDIVSKSVIEKIKKDYSRLDYILMSAKNLKSVNELVKLIKSKINKENIKVAVIGYPNTGKSTLINKLSKGGRARTSSESGFTRGLQLIMGKSNLMLFDTPGIVPYGDRNEIRLGLISGISPSKLKDPDLVAYKLIEIFRKNNPAALEKEYGVDLKLDYEEILCEIGKKKGMLLKKGVVDEKRAAVQLLIDWHKGKIRV